MELFSLKTNGDFALEPHEAGWAAEATLFVYVHEAHGPEPRLDLQLQISADGVRWVDFQAPLPTITGPGGCAFPFTHFGNWIRLRGAITGGPDSGEPAFMADFYWVFKS